MGEHVEFARVRRTIRKQLPQMTFHQRLAIKLAFALVVGLGYGLWRWVG